MRKAFTLIELIVVITVILILSSLIVGVSLTVNNKDRAKNGATTLVGALKEAQALALRDGKQYGVRLTSDTNGAVSILQLIEQPDDWVPPPGSIITPTGANSPNFNVTFPTNTYDFSGGWNVNQQANWPVQPGDYLEWGSGTPNPLNPKVVVMQIAGITPPAAPNLPYQITVIVPASGYTSQDPNNWRIVRQPKTRTGSNPNPFASGVIVDLSCLVTYPAAPSVGPFPAKVDVLFAPTGQVVGSSQGSYRFWVRDTTAVPSTSTLFSGEQYIVSVNTNTGFISIEAVDVTNNGTMYTHPYTFAQNPQGGF